MAERRISIAEISRVIPTTGSLPVVVMADDLEDYVCKYDQSSKLVNEYVSHRFLDIWNLKLPPVAFVTIKPEHVKQEFLQPRLQRHHFSKPCFALQFENNAIDINNLLLGLKGDYHELAKFENRFDLFKIALFDLWVANNDRNHNNYNLLIVSNQGKYHIYPIDHTEVIDGARLGFTLMQLTEEDSILSSDIAKVLFTNKVLINEYLQDLLSKFSTFVAECGKALHGIVQDIPEEWCPDKNLLEEQIRSTLIENLDWLTDTENNFKELIQTFLR